MVCVCACVCVCVLIPKKKGGGKRGEAAHSTHLELVVLRRVLAAECGHDVRGRVAQGPVVLHRRILTQLLPHNARQQRRHKLVQLWRCTRVCVCVCVDETLSLST